MRRAGAISPSGNNRGMLTSIHPPSVFLFYPARAVTALVIAPFHRRAVLSRFLQAVIPIHQVVRPFYAKNRAKTLRFLSYTTPGYHPGLLIFSSYGATIFAYRQNIESSLLPAYGRQAARPAGIKSAFDCLSANNTLHCGV
jgi:hypothetical protein